MSVGEEGNATSIQSTLKMAILYLRQTLCMKKVTTGSFYHLRLKGNIAKSVFLNSIPGIIID